MTATNKCESGSILSTGGIKGLLRKKKKSVKPGAFKTEYTAPENSARFPTLSRTGREGPGERAGAAV